MKKNIIKRMAFTLAEVLITLGIIGVVAQMTIPVLVGNVQKQSTILKVQKAYMAIQEAIELSELSNDATYKWDYGNIQDGDTTLAWFNKYLSPYLKYTKVEKASSGGLVFVYLQDGTVLGFQKNSNMLILIYTDFAKTVNPGKNCFYYILKPTATTKVFVPHEYNPTCAAKVGTREYWTCDPTYGCNTSATSSKTHCAGLMMVDGWRIADDYPW